MKNIIENNTLQVTTKMINKERKEYNPVKTHLKAEAKRVGIALPKLSKRDMAKVTDIAVSIGSASIAADKHLANSAHWDKAGKQGYKHIDRLRALTNAIEKFSKLNPRVFTNPKTKQAVLDVAWVAYAQLETEGLDNAHYTETFIPVNAAGDVLLDKSTDGFRNRWFKVEEVHAE